ncbi:type 2 isopentenyl-diphosphate Delta-isomerase [Brevundimonas sp. S30B]|uniref:type 2 isopentenyl-diphosphate Delta-isomerase n=1 Tax=unclassified Brevundimonas TaxID=2622653 RepID=UPI001071EFDC|nr:MULTISPECIES: type 2 isopentenyl-diphosphate Delta-isomerase [unclassified Brevundimonas]QBX37806.1 type 2 isopentenyl-diphosphate Delta-isomerase [Brevundimonas sp. MF30-B]TFW02838.1 type 2 isopentenyl-diphosphate Delta-isomerase [Brevundimonas sp. S30B]
MASSGDALVRRKDEHIDHVLAGRGQSSIGSELDLVRFQHNALPEIDHDAIDLSATLLGHRLQLPFVISSMTGGPSRAAAVNARLAEAAQAVGVALAVGSQRVALEGDADLGLDLDLRRRAPSTLLLANLGAVQFVKGYGLDQARRAVEMIGADGLILHLNPLQEAVQREGDRDWRGVTAAIGAVARAFPGRLVVKETGAGVSGAVARTLADLGVAALDVAGAGGTNWGLIEGARETGGPAEAVAQPFASWGISTARSLAAAAAAAPELALIGSGGVRSGLDAARAIRLGAQVVGQAAGLLQAALVSTEAVVEHFEIQAAQLRLACFCTGSADLTALAQAPLLNDVRF